MSCPAAWEELIRYAYPVMVADSYPLDPDDHVDDGVPVTAAEWDVM